MKHLLLLLLLSPAVSRSQISSVSIIGTENIKGRVSDPFDKRAVQLSERNDTCDLTYRNEEYSYVNDYRHLFFTNANAAQEALYQNLLSAFNLPKDKVMRFTLGGKEIMVTTYRAALDKTQIVVHDGNGGFGLYRKQLDLLFGKK